MDELVFKKQKKLTNIEWETFESLFDKKLPETFKKHYLEKNGGFVSEDDMGNNTLDIPIGFNSIKYGELTIEKLIDEINEYGLDYKEVGTWTRTSFVPFASGPCDIIFFISLRDEDYGYVYVFAPNDNYIGEVCKTFEEFFNAVR